MRPKLSHVAAAAALAGFLGFGGMSLAYAQDSGTSGTTTESPSTTPEQRFHDDAAAATRRRNREPTIKAAARTWAAPTSGSSSTEGTSM